MTLDNLLEKVESRLYTLGHKLWPPHHPPTLQDQADRMTEELQQGYHSLNRCRKNREELERRLADNELNAALLVSRIEAYVYMGDQGRAWEDALELDRIRQTLHRDRTRLEQHDEACRRQQAHVAQLEGRLATLQQQLYSR